MRPWIYTLTTYTGADADAIALAQSAVAGTSLALSGVLGGTLDVERTVQMTFAADESANRFSIKGRDRNGVEVYDVLTGTATTAESSATFKTVEEIVPERAGAGNVSAGIVVAVPTPWHPLDYVRADSEFNARINVTLAGTLATGYRIQAYQGSLGRAVRHPFNRFDLKHPIIPARIQDITEGGTPVTTSAFGQILAPCTAVRLLCLEALGAGESLMFEVLQGH